MALDLKIDAYRLWLNLKLDTYRLTTTGSGSTNESNCPDAKF